ncbi:MAG: hypothetical protein A3H97_15910 [Acidobacteria bacterium RIFCSPLOWO2_02_FULL_65_29]|nr:MAG: hypothetical protein A3H97_15910 [Acidobacteria bacterium RIFCSPLOWO2_02_FULL_65_29]
MRRSAQLAIVGAAAALGSAGMLAQAGPFRDHAAIQYSTRVPQDAVARLSQRIDQGELQLADEGPQGYLRSVLAALDITPSSQTLVFSENSLQRDHIRQATPRALYFNDSVAVGWAKGADTIEMAAHDPTQGVVFYSIPQKPQPKPRFVRRSDCLLCHVTQQTGGVPGWSMMSVLPLSDDKNEYAQGWGMDHRTPIEDRWGGWYVTGSQVPTRHLGNVPVYHVPRSYVRAEVAPTLKSGAEAFDTTAYLTPHSDAVALLVLNHQWHLINLLTRLGWEARIAARDAVPGNSAAMSNRVPELARELVDYMLLVDEAPLPSPVRGSSTFAQDFAAKGPRDSRGRSLRDLDLTRRLLRFPCSYMIYTDAFDALPPTARNMVYERMWEILSGKDTDKVYQRLSVADRRAIVEILRETKKGLPAYFF